MFQQKEKRQREIVNQKRVPDTADLKNRKRCGPPALSEPRLERGPADWWGLGGFDTIAILIIEPNIYRGILNDDDNCDYLANSLREVQV